MKNLKDLSKAELNAVLKSAQSEISRRKHLQTAALEIKKILKKYEVSLEELQLILSSQNKAAPAKKVAPKYKNPSGDATWSGRGRAPKWVKDICDSEGIDLQKFKNDPKFLINSMRIGKSKL